MSTPEHPAAKAGRLVRAVGLGIARELEKMADAPPKARPEPPPPPPPLETRGVVGRLALYGFVASLVAFLLVALRFEMLLGSAPDLKRTVQLVLAAILFVDAVLVLGNWGRGSERLVQRLLTRIWGPRGAVTRREKTFARACRDALTLVGIVWLAAAVFEFLTATVGS